MLSLIVIKQCCFQFCLVSCLPCCIKDILYISRTGEPGNPSTDYVQRWDDARQTWRNGGIPTMMTPNAIVAHHPNLCHLLWCPALEEQCCLKDLMAAKEKAVRWVQSWSEHLKSRWWTWKKKKTCWVFFWVFFPLKTLTSDLTLWPRLHFIVSWLITPLPNVDGSRMAAGALSWNRSQDSPAFHTQVMSGLLSQSPLQSPNGVNWC